MTEQTIAKIFIVEDNELNLKLFCDLLTSHNYEVAFTRDGATALESIRKFMPALVLMDVQLQGISGINLIKQLKEDKYIGSIPVVAVTAFAMKDDKEKIMESGCEAYIAKPISIDPFMQTITKFLKK